MPNEWSSVWSKDGKLKNEGCKYLPAPEGMKASVKVVDGKEEMHISGYASTSAVDSYNEIILPSAFDKWLPDFFKSPILLFMHDWYGMPIGKVQEARVDSTGLYVDAVIYATEMGKDVMLLITKSVLNAFSVGFIPMKWEMDEETNILTHTEVRLMELSVVNRGANPLSLFQEAKTAGVEMALRSYIINNEIKKDVPCTAGVENSNRRFSKMSEINMTELEKKFASVDMGDKVSSLASDFTRFNKRFDEASTTLASLVSEVKNGNPDWLLQVKRATDDVLSLRKDMDEIKAARKIDTARINFKDWRALDQKYIYVKDDNGRALSPMTQKAHLLFNLPIDTKSDEGQRLYEFRNLHDRLIMLKAASITGKFDWRRTQTFAAYIEEMAKFDEPLSLHLKSMYSTGTGVGDEWVPTEMSANVQEIYRLNPSIENYFENVDMPSNPFTWPLLTAGATAYRYNEPAVNNPVEITGSNLTTALVTFTARGVAARVSTSTEWMEDSIVAVAPVITGELTYCLRNAFEDMIINGDATGAAHRDTGYGYSANTNPHYTTYFDGLREIAQDLSSDFSVLSTSAGDGDAANTFGIEDVRGTRRKMKVMGVNPSELVYFTSVGGYFKVLALSIFTKANESGRPSTYVTGTLDTFDGSPLYISPLVSEELTTAGIYDGSTKTTTLIGCFNKRAFKTASRRGITLEVDKDIKTGQWTWVASFRRDFQNMQPSTKIPVSIGYNLVP